MPPLINLLEGENAKAEYAAERYDHDRSFCEKGHAEVCRRKQYPHKRDNDQRQLDSFRRELLPSDEEQR